MDVTDYLYTDKRISGSDHYFTQMLYQIRDCPQCIISLYNSQKSSEIFQKPNRSLIRAELSALRPIDLPTAIKRHQE